MILSVYGRFFKIYLYTALAPIPLATFAKQTNVEVNNRLICYDIIDLGSQLMPVRNACNT